jgi:ribosome-associated translation inhibitor RaiA
MSALTSIRIEGRAAGRIPRAHITSRVKELLKRLPGRPQCVRVTFGDVNGPKGGVDTRCGVLVSLPGEPVIRVERMGTTPRLAFDRAYERVRRTTERPRRRWRESQRHPKKQYAARRLWM